MLIRRIDKQRHLKHPIPDLATYVICFGKKASGAGRKICPYRLRDMAVDRPFKFGRSTHGHPGAAGPFISDSDHGLAQPEGAVLAISKSMNARFCAEVLKEMLALFGRPEILTDQRAQLRSEAFIGVVREHGVSICMNGKGRAIRPLGRFKKCGHYKYRVARIMTANEIKVLGDYKVSRLSSRSVSSNHLNRGFTAIAPNRVWATDTTDIKDWHRRLCLTVVLDLYSQKILGWFVKPPSARKAKWLKSRLNPYFCVSAW